MKISVTTIKKLVCKVLDIAMIDLVGASRSHDHVLARHIAIFLARRETGKSFPEIGRLFGNRDHTTVMHAISRVSTDLMETLEFQRCEAVLSRIKGNFYDPEMINTDFDPFDAARLVQAADKDAMGFVIHPDAIRAMAEFIIVLGQRQADFAAEILLEAEPDPEPVPVAASTEVTIYSTALTSLGITAAREAIRAYDAWEATDGTIAGRRARTALDDAMEALRVQVPTARAKFVPHKVDERIARAVPAKIT